MRQAPASTRHLLALLALIVAPLSAAAPPLVAPPGTPALPTGMRVNQGSASAAVSGQQLNVITSPNAVLQWQDFSIGAGYGVNFQQATSQSQVLNRVAGQNPSYILGNLTSNGRVWLLNPNGVLFGQNARVDVGGLVASTLNLRDDDFASGRYRLTSDAVSPFGGLGVINQGSITTAYGGQILLVSPNVENAGRLSAPGGHAALLATGSVELIDTGLPFLSFKVPVADGQAATSGSIQAQQIDVYGGVVNQQGLVRADSLSVNALGQIVLSATDTLDISGHVDASNANGTGGQILLRGDTVRVNDGALVDASGFSGGGVIATTRPGEERALSSQTLVESGARLQADATVNGNGGEIWLWSQSGTRVFGQLSARGGALGGDGGFIETSSHSGLRVLRAPDIGAARGLGGLWLIDPDRIIIQESGDSPDLDTAIVLTQDIESVLNDGGTVMVAAADSPIGPPYYGDVIVDGAIEKTEGGNATLILSATNDININQPITDSSSGGTLNLVVRSNTDLQGVVGENNRGALYSSLDLNGGTLDLASSTLMLGNQSSIARANITGAAPGQIILGPDRNATFDGVTLAAGLITSLDPTGTLAIQNGLRLGGVISGGTLSLGSSTLTLLDQSRLVQNRLFGTGQAQVVLGPGLGATFDGVILDEGFIATTVQSDSTLTIINGLTLNSLLQLVTTQTIPGEGRGASLIFVGNGPQLLGGSGQITTRDFDETASNDTAYIRATDNFSQNPVLPTLQIGSDITVLHEANGLSIEDLELNGSQLIVNSGSLRINQNSLPISLVNTGRIQSNSSTQVQIFSGLSNAASGVIQSDGGEILLNRLTGNAGTIQAGLMGFGGSIDINRPPSMTSWINQGTLRVVGSATMIADGNGDGSGWVNNGVATADGGQLQLDHLSSNSGTIRASVGGRVAINGTGPGIISWNNLGVIQASGAGSRVELFGDWVNSNPGVLDAAGGVVQFRSRFLTADIGTTSRSPGGEFVVSENGVWDNSDAQYDLAEVGAGHFGTVAFRGTLGSPATLVGGAISNSSSGAQLQISPSSVAVFDAVAISGLTIAMGDGSQLTLGHTEGAPDVQLIDSAFRNPSMGGSFVLLGQDENPVFDNVILGSGVTASVPANHTLTVLGNLTLDGILELATDGSGADLVFGSEDNQGLHQLLGSGQIQAGNNLPFGEGGRISAALGSTFSVGENVLITLRNNLLEIEDLVANEGAIVAERGIVSINQASSPIWTNAGIISAAATCSDCPNSTVELYGDLTNTGVLEAGAFGTLRLFGAWTNPSGTLSADGGRFFFRSYFRTQDIGEVVRDADGEGYFIVADGGTWDNSLPVVGTTAYDLGRPGNLGRVDFAYLGEGAPPKLIGGTLICSGDSCGAQTMVYSTASQPYFLSSVPSAIFDGVTLGAGMVATVASETTLNIVNGLTLDDGAVLRLSTGYFSSADQVGLDGARLIFGASSSNGPNLSGNGGIIRALRLENPLGESPDTPSGARITADGDVTIRIGEGVTVEAQDDSLYVGGVSVNEGLLQATTGGFLRVEGSDWINAGSGVIQANGGDIEIQLMALNQGRIYVGPDSRLYAPGGLINAATGLIAGSGTIDVRNDGDFFDLVNQGSVSPGGGPFGGFGLFSTLDAATEIGILTILGNYTQLSGTLAVQAASAMNVDALDVSGTATLGGSAVLELALIDDYEPSPTDVLTVMRYGQGHTGEFDEIDGPGNLVGNYESNQSTQLDISGLTMVEPPPVDPPPVDPPPVEPPPVEPPPVDPPPVEPPPVEPPPVEPPPVQPPPIEPPPVQPPPVEPPPVEPPVVEPPPVEPPPVSPPPVEPPPVETPPVDPPPPPPPPPVPPRVSDDGQVNSAMVNNLDVPPLSSTSGVPTTAVIDASQSPDFNMLLERATGDHQATSQDPSRYLLSDGDITVFRKIPVEQMSMSDIRLVLDERRAFKDEVFADAVRALERNPELADLPICKSLAEAETGRCILTSVLQKLSVAKKQAEKKSTTRVSAAIPLITKKRALVIGLNRYRDPRIPQLTSAVPDARAIRDELSTRLGYEVTILENPGKAEIARWLNRMALEMTETDSLVIYFAGHGELVEKTGFGYWIPSDATAKDATGWISNADVSRWLGLFQSKQVALIIDSCYSGAFAGHDGITPDTVEQDIDAGRYLDKRSIAVMTSGSDEPVADTGKNGHSVFAANLVEQIQALDKWRPGSNVFVAVRDQVERELPQSPQYGAAVNAGHQPGGDFLFERRQLIK